MCSSRFFPVDRAAVADILLLLLTPGLAISKEQAGAPPSRAAAGSLPGAE